MEWVRSSAKARQTKSKARLARYEEMLDAPQKAELSHSASIYIPPGPRLGKQVVEAKGVRKGFGERTLIDGLTFSLPPGGIVGVVGPNGAGKTTAMSRVMAATAQVPVAAESVAAAPAEISLLEAVQEQNLGKVLQLLQARLCVPGCKATHFAVLLTHAVQPEVALGPWCASAPRTPPGAT